MDNQIAETVDNAGDVGEPEEPPVLLDDEQTAFVVGLLKRLRLTRKALGKATGYSQSSISHMLATDPQKRRAAPRRVLRDLAARLNARAEEPGERPAFAAALATIAHVLAPGARGANNLNRESVEFPPLARRPVVQWGQCGVPSPAEGLTLEGWDGETALLPEEAGILREIGPRGFAVRIRGASMVGAGLRDGDLVWCNPDKGRGAYYGQPVLARLLDAATGADLGMVVKLLKRDDQGREYLEGKGPGGDLGPREYHFEWYAVCVFRQRLEPIAALDESTGGPRESTGGAVFLAGPPKGNENGNGHNGEHPAAAVIGLPPAPPLRRAG